MEENELQENIDSKYSILEKIGSGGQANVFRVVKIGTHEEYAAKVFKYDTDSITNEINMLQEVKQYQCPYIINIIDSGNGEVVRKNRKTKKRQYFIIEKEKNGCIIDHILYKQSGLGELYSKVIFQKILIGFQCLHKHNICHRDIKLENILFDNDFSPKICDFGMACFNSSNLIFKRGTLRYKPPEVNGITEYDGIKGDIFYLASALMILTTGGAAFKNPDINDDYFKYIYERNFNLYWNKIEPKLSHITLTSNFKDLFWKMISYEPKNRPTIDVILEHPWFKEINDMKKNNLKGFQDLEKEIKDFFPDITNYIRIELQKEDINSVNALYNKGISDNKSLNIFNLNAKPKQIDTPINMNYCIDIKGNLKPVHFMNRLYGSIKTEFGIEKCRIIADSQILKLNIIFEDDEEDDDSENDEKNNNNNIKIEIKLYQSSEKYVLRFKKKEGNRKDFIDKYKDISNLALKLLK